MWIVETALDGSCTLWFPGVGPSGWRWNQGTLRTCLISDDLDETRPEVPVFFRNMLLTDILVIVVLSVKLGHTSFCHLVNQ